MEGSGQPLVLLRSARLRAGALLALFCLPFFCGLDDSSIWDANEAFYVQTPREMVRSGNWLVPYFNGQPRLNKPPLSYWVVGLFYKLFGVDVFWQRVPMALLACGSILGVWMLGKAFFNAQVALLGAGIFATTFRILIMGRRLFIDVLLLFCVLWSIYFSLRWIRTCERRHALAAATFFSLAFLAKGPVALLPLPVLLLYLALSGQLSILRRLPWAAAAMVAVPLCSFWFLILGLETGWQVVGDFFLRENLGRFAGLDFGPRRGMTFYLPVFLGDFFPWSVLFLAAVVWTLRGEEREAARCDGRLLLGAWVVIYLAFFSLAFNKQEYYLAPLYPAAALWTALFLSRSRPASWLAAAMAVLVLILSALFLFVASVLLPAQPSWLALAGIALFIWAVLLHRPLAAASGLSVFYLICFLILLQPLEQYRPVKPLAEAIRSHAGSSTPFQAGYFEITSPSLSYYLDQPVFETYDPDQAARFLSSDVRSYLIIPASQYQELQRLATRPLQIVTARPKLYTTARNLIRGLGRGRTDNLREVWTQSVYLVANSPSR